MFQQELFFSRQHPLWENKPLDVERTITEFLLSLESKLPLIPPPASSSPLCPTLPKLISAVLLVGVAIWLLPATLERRMELRMKSGRILLLMQLRLSDLLKRNENGRPNPFPPRPRLQVSDPSLSFPISSAFQNLIPTAPPSCSCLSAADAQTSSNTPAMWTSVKLL